MIVTGQLYKNYVSEPINESVYSFRCELICSEGFTFNKDTNECDSICDIPCTNGICTRPNVCKCNAGYHVSMSEYEDIEGDCIKTECNPVTPESDECLNGKCTPHGTCRCNDGFIKDHSTLNGSKNESTVICKPVCSSGCFNGSCVKPDVCHCDNGFEYNLASKGCIEISSYCEVCRCVHSVFAQPLNVPKLCYMLVIVAALVVVIVCAFSVFLYRRYIKRINHAYNVDVVTYHKEEDEGELDADKSHLI